MEFYEPKIKTNLFESVDINNCELIDINIDNVDMILMSENISDIDYYDCYINDNFNLIIKKDYDFKYLESKFNKIDLTRKLPNKKIFKVFLFYKPNQLIARKNNDYYFKNGGIYRATN